MNKVWKIQSDKIPSNINDLAKILLKERGIEDEEIFFHPMIDHIHSPNLLFDIDKAVDFVLALKEQNEKVYIYGDYDADGILATTILWNYLYKELGINAVPIIPDRIEDGYGMNNSMLERIIQDDTSAVITVDCGVRDIDLIEEWKEKGLKFLITDHHEFRYDEDNQPMFDIDTVYLHPRHPKGKYPNKYISGGVVAWKLVWALEERLHNQNDLTKTKAYDSIDLAALSTISDIMPLTGENRALVAKGIETMKETKNLGLKQLMQDSSIKPDELASYHLGYILAPRINAAGRIGDAMDSVRLLSSDKPDFVRQYSTKLNSLNQERQLLTKDFLLDLKSKFNTKQFKEKKIIIVEDDDLHEGVIGLIAGKLCETYQRPVIVLTETKEGNLKGSARSIPQFDITAALSQFSDLLLQYGGHVQASGLTISKENLTKLQEELENYAETQISEEDIAHTIDVDVELNKDLLNLELVDFIERFEPFGFGNDKPLFTTNDFTVSDFSIINGKNGSHLKLFLTLEDFGIEAIGFGLGDREVNLNDKISVVYYPERNSWNGNTKLQLVIKDFKVN